MKSRTFKTAILAGLVALFGLAYIYPSAAEEENKDIRVRKLSLDDCLKDALINSFEVRLAKLDYMVAETDVLYSQAVFDTLAFGNVSYREDKSQQEYTFIGDDNQINMYGIGFTKELPIGTEIGVSWQDTRNWNNFSNPFFITKNPYHEAVLTFEAKQPVGKNFFGYIDRNTVNVTKMAVENADLGTKERIEIFIAEVAKAYWAVVAAKKRLGTTEDILKKARALHESNSKNYDLGAIEKADFLASEANLILSEADVIFAVNSYRENEENLKLLLNMEEDIRIYPAEEFSLEKSEYDVATCLRIAFENRWDYKIRKRDIDIRNLEIKIKDNQMWPEIDLTGSFAMNGLEQSFTKAAGKTVVADNTNYVVGIEVSFPVENSAARSEFKKAKYEKEIALVNLKETERTIITEVVNAFRNLRAAETNAVSVSRAAKLQAEKLEEEEKRYKYGRSMTKVLIDYQNDLLRADLRETQALLNMEVAKIDLEKAMNIILDKYKGLL